MIQPRLIVALVCLGTWAKGQQVEPAGGDFVQPGGNFGDPNFAGVPVQGGDNAGFDGSAGFVDPNSQVDYSAGFVDPNAGGEFVDLSGQAGANAGGSEFIDHSGLAGGGEFSNPAGAGEFVDPNAQLDPNAGFVDPNQAGANQGAFVDPGNFAGPDAGTGEFIDPNNFAGAGSEFGANAGAFLPDQTGGFVDPNIPVDQGPPLNEYGVGPGVDYGPYGQEGGADYGPENAQYYEYGPEQGQEFMYENHGQVDSFGNPFGGNFGHLQVDGNYTDDQNGTSFSSNGTGPRFPGIKPSRFPTTTTQFPFGEGACKWNDKPYGAGARVDHGSFWYECQDENFSPRGCFSDMGDRLFFGQSYNTSNGYEMMCERTANGTFHIVPVACIHQDVKYLPGDTFQDDFYWYTCRLDGEAMVKHVSGCIDSKGERVAANEVLKLGEYIYSCAFSENQNGMWFQPVACLHRGERYEVGEKMIEGQFWYKCKKHADDFIVAELTGCVYGNRTMEVGNKYNHGGFVYQCQKKQGDGSLVHGLIGCLETNFKTGEIIKEKRFGQTWAIGNPPFMFMTRCEQLEGGGARQVLTQCMYHEEKGANITQTTTINPGCYKQVTQDMVVMCYSRSDGALIIDRTTPDNLDKPISDGLIDCL